MYDFLKGGAIVKTARLIFVLLFTVSVILGITACGDDAPDNSFISISQKVINFDKVGEETQITAQVFSGDINAVPEFSSSNPEIAVYENGTVRAIGYGTCIIRAQYKNISATCTVNVKNPYSSLVLSSSLFEFDSVGAESAITARSGDNDLTALVKWGTTNPAVAICDTNGFITITGFGACLITAELDKQTASAAVIVTDPNAPLLILSETELELNEGEIFKLSVESHNNAGTTIKWFSSDPDVIECSNGNLTAKSSGVCAVVAVSEKGISAFCTVTVGEPAEQPSFPADMLSFVMPEVPHIVHSVDRKTGTVLSSALITSYTVTPVLNEQDNKLFMQIRLNCIKIYDIEGINGTTSSFVATNLYREDDIHCERRLYEKKLMRVGDAFTVDCARFNIQLNAGELRSFYMTLENICELKERT